MHTSTCTTCGGHTTTRTAAPADETIPNAPDQHARILIARATQAPAGTRHLGARQPVVGVETIPVCIDQHEKIRQAAGAR
jgi:hypothetical protein